MSRTADVVTTLVTAALVAATVLGEASGGEPAHVLVIDSVTGVVSVLCMPLLVRVPIVGGVALSVLAAMSPAGTPGATIAVLHLGWRRPPVSAAGVAALGVAAHLMRWVWRPYPGISFGWWVILVIAGYAALLGWGALERERGAVIDGLRERAARAEAEQGRLVAEARAQERAAIAREMHDVLAHRLSLLATYAGALEYRPDSPPERLAQAAGVVRSGVHDALQELREVIGVLRDPDTGWSSVDGDRPQPGVDDIAALVAECRSTGMPLTWVHTLDGEPPATTGRAAYRIVQEGLTNARKHAPARPVDLSLTGSPGDLLTIEISNPMAPDGAASMPGSGKGLVGLAERARLLGGTLDHRVTEDGRFVLQVRLPWPL